MALQMAPLFLILLAPLLAEAAAPYTIPCPKVGYSNVGIAYFVGKKPEYPNVPDGAACAAKCRGSKFYVLKAQLCTCSDKCLNLTRFEEDNPTEVGVPGALCPLPGSKATGVFDVQASGRVSALQYVGTPEACANKCQGAGFYVLNPAMNECVCYNKCEKTGFLKGNDNTYQVGYPPKTAAALKIDPCPKRGSSRTSSQADVVFGAGDEGFSFMGSTKKCTAYCKGRPYYLYNNRSGYCYCPGECSKLEGMGKGKALEIGIPS